MAKQSVSPTVASFFSGAGGLDLGFKKAGFKTVIANDNWKSAAETFICNFPSAVFIEDDIKNVKLSTLKKSLQKTGVKKIDIVIGGPPCQCFTRLNNNNLRKDDERSQLFREYIRIIRHVKPRFVVMENVADLLVRKDEKGRFFKDMIREEFERIGYRVEHKVFETEKYGIPQKRRRVIFLAAKTKNNISFPKPSSKIATVGTFLRKLKGRENLKNHEIPVNMPSVKEKIKNVPPGGYYENLPDRLKTKKIRNGKLVIVKRYGSYFRRLHNDQPSITITNNYIIHPDEDRYITNREKAVLHTFPLGYEFFGSMEDISQQIANAVPPTLAYKIAKYIKKEYFTMT